MQSVLIWNNADIFAFPSPDCSGSSLAPSQIVPVPLSGSSTCFTEYPRPQVLPPSASVLVSIFEGNVLALLLNTLGFSLWTIGAFPTRSCHPLPQPSSPTPPTAAVALDSVGIIGIFTDYLLPLLLLAFCCRSLLFRPPASRLTLPRFSKLWHCRSDLHSRCAAWFLISTLIDFITQVCSNLSALDSKPFFLWNWIGIFPTSMLFRPVMACLLFLNPDRFTASVSIVEGCLMAANAYLRLQFLPSSIVAPRVVSIIPPLMFVLSNVVFFIHPDQSVEHYVRKSTKNTTNTNSIKSIAISICDAIFGSPSPTFHWHSNHVSELVHVLFTRPSTASNNPGLFNISQAAFIAAPKQKRNGVRLNRMSARMMTLLFLAAYWSLFWLSLFGSLTVSVRNFAFDWDQRAYADAIIVITGILLFCFSVIFCCQLVGALKKYNGRFARMSKLCRIGLVPPRTHSATAFHYAAKYVSSEALVCFGVGVVIFVIGLIYLVILYLQRN